MNIECKCLQKESKDIILALLRKEIDFMNKAVILANRSEIVIAEKQIEILRKLHIDINNIKECR